MSVGVKAGATTTESSSFAQSSSKDESRLHVAYLVKDPASVSHWAAQSLTNFR